MTLGNWATRYILGRQVSISRVRGQRFPWHGRTVIPTFHPAAILHGGGQASPQMIALRADFQEIATALAERPQPVEEQLGLFLSAGDRRSRAPTAEDTRAIGAALAPLLRAGRRRRADGRARGRQDHVVGAGRGRPGLGYHAARGPRRPSPWSASTGRHG